MKNLKTFESFVNEAKYPASDEFPTVGDIVKIQDVDYDLMDYFKRTNRKLIYTLTNGKKVKGSVGKFFNDIVFFPDDVKKEDIKSIKIIK